MRKFLCFMLGMLLMNAVALAQNNRTITGTVTDDKGAPVPNASVIVKGTTLGTTTNANGTFTLSVPSNARTLVISAVGMGEREVTLTNATNYPATLSPTAGSMDEVVVVGYQTMRKREVTTAISKVAGEEILNLPTQSFDRAIQGRAPGVDIRSSNGLPGGAVNVRIRGVGSISAGNNPLYVVDGVQLNSNVVNFGTTWTQTNPLAYLNPNDIESIEVLKDAAAASIYGAQAGNGVILITTKKGRGQRTNITVNTYYGITEPLKYLNVGTTQQYIQARSEAIGNANNLSPNDPAVLASVLSSMGLPTNLTKSQIDSLPTYDWQDAAFRRGNVKNVDVSLSSGGDKTTYYISAGFNQQDAIVIPADFQRGNFLANIGHRVNNKLLIETQLTASTIRQLGPFASEGSFLGNPAFSAALMLPHNPIYNPDGSFAGIPPSAVNGILNQNVIAVVNFNNALQRTNQFVGNLSLTYSILPNLRYRGTVGIDYRLAQSSRFSDPRTPDGFNVGGRLTEVSNWNTNYITFHTLTYNTTFADRHNVSVLGGFEYKKDQNEQIFATGIGFPTFQFRTLNSAATPESMGGQWTAYAVTSQFAKINYDFDKRFLLTASLRRDGSSRFGANTQYGIFPSVSVGWNLVAESFMKNVNFVSDAKLRASWGRVGNDQIGNFDSRGLFGATSTYNGGAGIGPTQIANPDLSWESREDINFGLDYGFLRNRITGSFDVYRRDNFNLLLNRPVAPSTGIPGGGISQNLGSVRNTGYEFMIRGRILDGAFKWTSTFNISHNDNKVTKLYDTLKFLPADASIRIGESLGSWYTVPYAGVNPATGRPMWYDLNGNLVYTANVADRRIMGNTLNDYYGGFGNNFSFKNFELDVFFNYEYGRVVSDGQINFMNEIGGRAFNFLTETFENRWQKPGDITGIPRSINGNAEVRGSSSFAGSRPLLKADYIRLKQITLSYNFNSDLLRKIKVASAQFYVQGMNLWTYTEFPGYDPEFGATSTGIVPQSKNYTVGLRVGL